MKMFIYIYEPSRNYTSKPTIEPKLSVSALILMKIKKKLIKFNTLRLQKTAYVLNIFSNQKYFKFEKRKYGPYDNSIAIISRNIREFQDYHNVKNTEEAYSILYNKIISNKVEEKLNLLGPFIDKSAQFVNLIETDHELECLATIVFLIETNKELNEEEILVKFKEWSIDKANRFSKEDIIEGIGKLYKLNIIDKTFMGYSIAIQVNNIVASDRVKPSP